MGKTRTLCDWDKDRIKSHADELYRLVHDPRYVCRKCARVANDTEVLCKPMKLPRGTLADVG
ncbi:MAG: hypothetical protein KDC38_01825 [Planctomycetes bacterium]|nr:hypothetical protein [Planctomycetota bacterium]